MARVALLTQRDTTRATVAEIGKMRTIMNTYTRMGRRRLDLGVVVLEDDEVDQEIEVGDRIWLRGRRVV